MTARALLLVSGLSILSCGARENDPHSVGGLPSTVGAGARVREVSNPADPRHAKNLSNVIVTGVTVTLTDTFDETGNGKSRGNIFVQDVDSQEPFSGMTLYAPTFVPGDLRVAPGDVLDLNGQYQEIAALGSAVFPTPPKVPVAEVLLEIAKPVATFRFEYQPPTARVIDAADLDSFSVGRQWMGMLVTIKDVTLTDDLSDSGCRKDPSSPTGRQAAHLTPALQGVLVNELLDLKPGDPCAASVDYAKGTHFASITGVVTYFFTMHLAPRSAADFVK